MNDKQQLAAMGEHLAVQQPLCMAKRIEELEAQARVMAELLAQASTQLQTVFERDPQYWDFHGLVSSIDALLAAHAPEPIYYMRDNHTFKRLSDDVDTAIKEIETELDDGWSSGMLCSKRGGFSSLHANSRRPREEFLSDCRDALLAAAPKPEAK